MAVGIGVGGLLAAAFFSLLAPFDWGYSVDAGYYVWCGSMLVAAVAVGLLSLLEFGEEI